MTTKTEERAESLPSLSERDDAISTCLVEARLTAQPLPDFPDRVPETLEQAYAIQAASIARWPDEVAGWKVAMIAPAQREQLAAERLAGPVFGSSIHRVEPGSCTVMPVYEGGFAAVEAEFVLELGTTVAPTGRDYSDEELIDIVSAVYGGSEIASSPMAVVNERGATSVISDLGNNAGVLMGPEIPDWGFRPLESLSATVTVDGAIVGDASAASVPRGLLGALRFLVDHCAARGIEMPAGTVVSTGAVTGVHDVTSSSTARIDYGPFGWFDVAFEPRKPLR